MIEVKEYPYDSKLNFVISLLREKYPGIDVGENSKKQELLDKADELIKQANELKSKAKEL